MDRSIVISLIAETVVESALHVPQAIQQTERDIFADVTSVTGSEWFEGGRNGIVPEYRMIVFKYDYQGEQLLRYNGTVYQIYRTYERRTDELELYCAKRKGPGGV